MLVFENKLKDFLSNENSDLIQEENEFIKKFLFSIEAELFGSQSQQNNLIDMSEISENTGKNLNLIQINITNSIFLKKSFFREFLSWIFRKRQLCENATLNYK